MLLTTNGNGGMATTKIDHVIMAAIYGRQAALLSKGQ